MDTNESAMALNTMAAERLAFSLIRTERIRWGRGWAVLSDEQREAHVMNRAAMTITSWFGDARYTIHDAHRLLHRLTRAFDTSRSDGRPLGT